MSAPRIVAVRAASHGELRIEIDRLTRRIQCLRAIIDGTAVYRRVKREGYHVKAHDVPAHTVLLVDVPGTTGGTTSKPRKARASVTARA
jgi:hypothetical protein